MKSPLQEKTINVLLIEDDPDDTMILVNLLAQPDWPSFKFTLVCAETLKSGLKLLTENDVEAILLDLMLPDSRDIETVLKVRAQAPDIPIVVLTGLRDEALGISALSNGAQDYQVKGNIDGHALKRTISYAVERHRLVTSLKNIIESAPDGMLIADSKGAVQYANPAAEALFSRKGESLLGKPFPFALPKNRSGELKIPVEGGTERIAEMRISDIDWKDQPAKLISVRDITDLRRIEQLKAEVLERRKMDQLKDELMNAVSHGMRSPLTIIKAASSNMKEGLTGPLSEQQTTMVGLQYKNILRLEKIVDHILDLARLESGKAEIKRQSVNAAQLIRDTVSGFRLIAGEHNILIKQELPQRLPPIHVDPELFIQVLSNLMDNALRFAETMILVKAETMTPKMEESSKGGHGNQGVLVLTARKYVQISVIDDGKGIPKDRIGDLFNKFVQISRTSKGESYKGTGLGLAICKEIIERQEGKIWVESDEGHGTQFHFMLPQYEPHPTNGHGETYGTK